MTPSHKTIVKKISLALKASISGDIALVDPDVIAADLTNLGRDMKELPAILSELLENTDPRDYTGTRPPQRSYESVISGCELYAFKKRSKHVGCAIYYKFTIKDDTLWLVSLHEDRPEKKRY
jgi:tetrahydromethanopterin S-methyltransferase subunit B